MVKFDEVKKQGKAIFKKSKEISKKVVKNSGTAMKVAKINAEIILLNNKIKKSKVKLGDMIYQLDVNTKNKKIDDLKLLIKNALEEIKYLETKKSK